ncbi:cation-transporting P-type ATPase [Streptomyces sp. NPDC007856]|uniref:cation-transporting P-type ATPase n=1 Tax=Streptomyces sp. NPDC007856 TaxID=3364781 RepID=UPI00368156EE
MACEPSTGPWTGPSSGTSLQVLRHLDTGPCGLTDAEAAARLATHGENARPARTSPPRSGAVCGAFATPW